MKLKIDTTEKEAMLCLDGECISFPSVNELRQQEVLRSLEQFLESKNQTLQSITAIEVNCGPGSFTGTRVGVTIANILSRSLNIPLTDNTGKTFEIALPVYSGPAHITTPKSRL